MADELEARRVFAGEKGRAAGAAGGAGDVGLLEIEALFCELVDLG